VAAGRVVAGARGNAGEFGHLVLDPQGPLCPAGHRGCIESFASGTALARDGRERQQDSAFLRTVSVVDAKAVFDGWAAGDRVCADIIAHAAERLGLAMSYLVNLFNPERIAIGGGVGVNAPDAYFSEITKWAQQYSLPALFQLVEWRRAELGAESGVIGALAVALAHRTDLA
jgi:glucokinase